ncbi:hypothetical protein DN601_07455 [Klebsiella quasipneumoniae subsp. similipneumoniae]|nr:hypothetical protein DN601_07455 [Klebsiella quasipneumoniae subsp. similipneumoniae]
MIAIGILLTHTIGFDNRVVRQPVILQCLLNPLTNIKRTKIIAFSVLKIFLIEIRTVINIVVTCIILNHCPHRI